MEIDSKTLQKIAHLSRLELDPTKESGLKKDLEKIIEWVDQLNEVETEGIEPLTNMSFEVNAFRKDQIGETLSRERGLRNAPEHDEEYFRVPKVLD